MAEDVKDPKELRKELLAKCTIKLPRLYTGMPKIHSPFGDGIPSQEFFREDVMIGAQWMRDHPGKRPFSSKDGRLHFREDDLAELEAFITTVSPTHNLRTMGHLMVHLRAISEDGLGMYATSFLNPTNSQQVG